MNGSNSPDDRFQDLSLGFIDLPPADPIAFQLAQLAEPGLTYHAYVQRWQANTRRLKAEREMKHDAPSK